MNIRQERNGDKLVLYIEGRIDSNNFQALSDFVKNNLSGVKDLTLDLEKVDYISSAGLRTILQAQKIMDAQGKMCVAHVNDDIMETFELTCFTDFLTII
jgi:anti-sigma B factor antagonist